MANTFKTTLTQIRRTPYQALAAVMVLTLTFLAATIFAFLFFGAQKVLKYFESTPQVIAFFEKGEDLKEAEIANIKNNLEATGKLSSFKYVSTREAEAIYKDKNKNDPLLLELVDYKILPPSIEISATQIEALANLKNILEKQPKVTDVVFYEDIINTLTLWINNLRLVGLVLIVYLTVQSILILILIVSLKILTRKEEIEILQLLGASFWFIAKPFLLEGMFYGIMAALLSFILATSLLLYATPMILNWVGEIPLFPISSLFFVAVLTGEIIAGGVLGIIASLLGVRRFLKY
jgi:cell division transport system permease protein